MYKVSLLAIRVYPREYSFDLISVRNHQSIRTLVGIIL